MGWFIVVMYCCVLVWSVMYMFIKMFEMFIKMFALFNKVFNIFEEQNAKRQKGACR